MYSNNNPLIVIYLLLTYSLNIYKELYDINHKELQLKTTQKTFIYNIAINMKVINEFV